jgi:hypothetical protein
MYLCSMHDAVEYIKLIFRCMLFLFVVVASLILVQYMTQG